MWAVALGGFYVTRTPPLAPRVGAPILMPGLTAQTISAVELRVLPRDSPVAVLATTAECAACRIGLPSYREIAAQLKDDGVALRVIVASDSLPASQFARLLPEPGAVVWDPRGKLLRKLGIRTVPTLHLVGRDGRLLRSWSPVPRDPGIAEAIASAARTAR